MLPHLLSAGGTRLYYIIIIIISLQSVFVFYIFAINGHDVSFSNFVIQNDDFIDEEQEYVHIIISSRCIYIIETKNYKGKLTIAPNGNWIRTDEKGNQRGERSPISQVDRHHKLLLSILGNQGRKSDVVDILCIAHDSAIIEGYENSPIPIVKVDMLNRFIQRIESKKKDKYDPEVIADLIEDFKVWYEN